MVLFEIVETQIELTLSFLVLLDFSIKILLHLRYHLLFLFYLLFGVLNFKLRTSKITSDILTLLVDLHVLFDHFFVFLSDIFNLLLVLFQLYFKQFLFLF